MSQSNSTNQPFISVIIPVFNNSKQLRKCLQALSVQTYDAANYEIIVVDNGSSENLADVVKDFSQIKLIFEKQEGSYAARNLGISESRGEVLAFTDADCLPHHDWLEKGVSKLCETAKCGIVGGRIILYFEDVNAPTFAELYESLTYLNQKHFVENLNFSATANLFTFRQVFEKVGLFDTNLRSGGDFEWGKRVFAADYKLIYAEDVLIRHPARKTTTEVLRRQQRIRGGAWKLKKNNVRWVNPHELNLLFGLVPPIRRSINLWQKMPLQSFGKKMQIIGVEWLSHYFQWLELLRLTLGGEPKR